MSNVDLRPDVGQDEVKPNAVRQRIGFGKHQTSLVHEGGDWAPPDEETNAAGSAGIDMGRDSQTAKIGPTRQKPRENKDPVMNNETFVSVERRRIARTILHDPDLLMMAAVRDDETFQSTRLKYRKLLCGIEDTPPSRTRASERQPGHPSSKRNESASKSSTTRRRRSPSLSSSGEND
ncbi:hypothetical protein F5Y16DRAFT_406228 [Xylariaceae sp. FL0255]|nr:hypothetical protein F5Y16DRAFT_406228 [Xylariaceae sp. FL0255]